MNGRKKLSLPFSKLFVCLLDLMMLTQSEEWVHVGFSEDIAMARVGVLAMSESKSGQKWERVYLNSQDLFSLLS